LEASPSPALGVRALSGTRTVVNAAARASYESAVLAAVRRQIEAFEEKVENQISKLQVQGDKSKDTSLSRLEEKVSAAEGLQPRVERRLAELSGNFKGLSDEMQAQIRRVDLLDDRRWEWRHQVEEEMQKKCQGYEQQVQALASKLRSHVAVEDTLKQHHQRLQRLESELQRSSFHEEIRESFGHVCGRLELLEGRSEALVDKATADALLERSLATKSDDFVSSSIYEVLSKRLEDLGGRIEEALQDNRDVHSRVASQEEQIRALRTLFETREEHLRLLAERVERSDWDVKLEQIRQALQDSNKQRTLEAERLVLLSKKVEDQEQLHDDLQRELASHASGKQDAEMAAAVAGLEDQLKTLGLELQELRDHDDLGPRVADLLSQLREIAPKVIEQEKSIRLLQTSEPFQKEIRLLQEEIGTLRSSIASKSSSSTDAVSEKIKEELMKSHAELREQMAASAQVTAQLRELQETTATDLRQQVGELKTSCENAVEKVQTEWKDHLTGLEKSFKQFKAEAHSQEESLQSLQSQLAPLQADGPDEKWLQLQQDVSGELKEHRHRTEESQKELASELYRLVEQSKSEVRTELAKALKAVQGPELELQEMLITARKELKGELETLQDLRSKMEAAAAEDSKVAGDQATEFRHIFEQHAAQLKSMEAQLECQKTLKEELDSAKDQVAELQSSTSALNMPSERIEATRTSLNALEQDVAGLKTKLNATPASQESVEELKLVVEGFQDRLESAALKDEVTHLSERVNALIAAQFKKSGGQRQDLEEEFENLAATLQKDEEAESVAHTRLLLRIDELCRNISKATDGGANDWASKFASLAHQVEEMQKAEKQMEVQLASFVSKLA